MARIRVRPAKTWRWWIGVSFVLAAVFITVKVLELAGVMRP